MYVQHESVDTINCITLYWKTVHMPYVFSVALFIELKINER